MTSHRAADCPSSAPSPDFTSRAPAHSRTHNVRANLTSGFSSVMEQEHDLQNLTHQYLGTVNGRDSGIINRILCTQQVTLGANIALLEQRYELLPHAERFHVSHGRLAATDPAADRPSGRTSMELLPDLVAHHIDLLRKIDALVARGSNGQRGELILTEVARNHEQMACTLTALLKGDDKMHDGSAETAVAPVATTSPAAIAANAAWENEGGPVRPTPPPVSPAPEAPTIIEMPRNP